MTEIPKPGVSGTKGHLADPTLGLSYTRIQVTPTQALAQGSEMR
jgi:hypothetical protein